MLATTHSAAHSAGVLTSLVKKTKKRKFSLLQTQEQSKIIEHTEEKASGKMSQIDKWIVTVVVMFRIELLWEFGCVMAVSRIQRSRY